jgi:hypothetical protein
VTSGVPIRSGGEVSPLREGGGRIDLTRADHPFVFSSPTSISFGLRRPRARATRTLRLSDAGGGAGQWSVQLSAGSRYTTVPGTVTVPGGLPLRLAIPARAPEGDVSGFVNLARGSDTMRVPFWFRVERPRLRLDRHLSLSRPGIYAADSAGGAARVTSYRYPDIPPGTAPFPVRLPGREVVYRVHIRRPLPNFGVAVLGRSSGVAVEPRIVRAGDENRLAGETALPFESNPYRPSYGQHRLVAGVTRPAPGLYDIVFDTPRGKRSGHFRFRYWQGDTTPPQVRVLGVRGGALRLAVTDAGSGVDPESLSARVDGDGRATPYSAGVVRISLAGLRAGRHRLVFSVADYQEIKNTENVAAILPNTRRVQRTFVIP